MDNIYWKFVEQYFLLGIYLDLQKEFNLYWDFFYYALWLIDLRPCQHDNGYMDGRSQIEVHTDERTQVHSAQSSLEVTHSSINRARRYLTSVTKSPS